MKFIRLILISVVVLSSCLFLACDDDDDPPGCPEYCDKAGDCMGWDSAQKASCTTDCNDMIAANGASCSEAISTAAGCVQDHTCLEIDQNDACENELRNMESSCPNH